jgi:hypothetical protein
VRRKFILFEKKRITGLRIDDMPAMEKSRIQEIEKELGELRRARHPYEMLEAVFRICGDESHSFFDPSLSEKIISLLRKQKSVEIARLSNILSLTEDDLSHFIERRCEDRIILASKRAFLIDQVLQF